ncbi:SPOR domain-containing protein [Halomonas daqiaonensis]|uniref:Sporulation related domain-containing protein n=1 Tax=Halomonas daqiaonensis TaxID=650850 RepID=A0A1H7PGB8_9GAMM|nr:SPOR domain-containing protein [Halomonas daqiaonensis]SEL34518.1 Sporulation related domain-containing protein [Halomonas daqiaonensis]
MASSSKPAPRKRGATSSPRRRTAPPPRRGIPGWLWGLVGLVAGFLLAQHQQGIAPWQEGSDSPLATVLTKPGDRQESREGEPTAAPEEPPMPTFEFYTLLPESEVIAPGGKVPASTATPPERPETPEATTSDDPIAQVIAANLDDDAATRDNRPDAQATDEPKADARFMLQAASFRESGDASKLAGRLRDFGLLAKISEVKAGGGDTWHRVQVGPYSDRRELNRAQDLMVTQGIEPLLIQLQN